MTGIEWPTATPVSVPVRSDFATLNLASKHVPVMLSLCLGCSIEYMQTFNRLLKERRTSATDEGASSQSS